MLPASMLKMAIASVAILAALPRSVPVLLASSTVDLAAPSNIWVMSRPLRASISIAAAASSAVTFNVGSSPRSRIRSPSGAISSRVRPITAAMLAMFWSIVIAAPTALRPISATAPPTATAPAVTAPRATAPAVCRPPSPVLARLPRDDVTLPIGPLALSLAKISMAIFKLATFRLRRRF